MPLTVGIIGAGAMGKRHAAAYRKLPDVQVTAVAGIDKLITSFAGGVAARGCGRPAHAGLQTAGPDPEELVAVCAGLRRLLP